MEKGKQEKKVVHLIIKGDTRDKDIHSYYGSVACIYNHYDAEDIGITYGSLRNYGLSENKPYENKKVIIRQGKLWTKDRKDNM